MPFDFPAAGQDMANLTIQATNGLEASVRNAYGYTDDVAYRHSGISSMNGITDANEIVTVANFQTILAYANLHHLGRLTFWSVNRDRPCSASYPTTTRAPASPRPTGTSPAPSPNTPADPSPHPLNVCPHGVHACVQRKHGPHADKRGCGIQRVGL